MYRIVTIFLLLLSGFNHFLFSQCTSSSSFGFLTSGQTICGNDVFARRIYIEQIVGGSWTLATVVDRLPMKINVHGGVRINLYHGVKKLDKATYLTPSFYYKRQGDFFE